MSDEAAERKKRAAEKFKADRAALLAKAQKRLEAADDESDEEPQWTTDKSGRWCCIAL